ncbi:MAG: ABC-F family ATP-binding cassette domain-containing protein [Planctomycetes bacterium]|nr:ABC-F family ATP-binding cassette domain-containing protein [Planctomycetota bacterium]
MAVLLDIKNACKRYGDQVLLNDANATITDGGRVGFIGRNGAGKSTLLQIILGEEELDSGKIVRHSRLRLGYLRQHDPFEPGESALDFLMRDSGQPDWKCGEVAGDFELKGPRLTGPVKELSGGWQTRVKLAALLLHEPNLLLLDEPTNFLDLRTQILLEHFLCSYREACLVVSHDRAFLGATCDQTLDLAHGRLTLHPGPVDDYLVHQRERRLTAERTNATVLVKKRELEDFIARNRARASTASRAKSKAKQLERLEFEEIQVDAPTAAIRCPEIVARRGTALRCRDLVIGYADHSVASEVSLDVVHGTRAAIVGDNGQGKTTLLRTIVGSLPPLAGDVRWGHGCEIGTYAQHVYTSLDERRTVLEQLEHVAAPGTKQQRILDVAAAMLFRRSGVDKSIAVLSGGERARLCLAGLLLGSANVLVLDEPGNHLDVETVEALAGALADYRGTLVFTSHDRSFMRAVATTVIEVRDGRVIDHLGDYDAYVTKVTSEIDAAEAAAGRHRGPAPPRSGRQAKGHDDRAARREVASLEKSIAKFGAEKGQLHHALMAATDPAEALRLHEALGDVERRLAAAEERWLELQDD